MTVWRIVRAVLAMTVRSVSEPGSAEGGHNRAKEYNRAKQRVILAGMLVSIVSGAALITSRLPARLSGLVNGFSRNRFARRSAFTAIVTVIEAIASLPLGYYSGYRLEHRYQLSNQSRVAWFVDQLKGMALALPFSVVVANVMLEIIERWPRRWWIITTALALPFTVLLSQLAPVLIAPLFNRFEPLKDEQLAARLKALAARSGINVASVLQMDMSRQTKKANAFFAGLGRTRRIVLADTLLDNFSPDEIEVVVAHEIAHQAHRDLWRFVALGTVFTAALSFAVDRVAGKIVRKYGRQVGVARLSDVTALPLLSWLLSIFALGFAPLQNMYSRLIERRADTYALELTQNPSAFASAMRRLGDLNLSDPSPSRFVKYIMYSHPPITERIERARRFERDADAREPIS